MIFYLPIFNLLFIVMVRVTGFEPAHFSVQEPKSCVSAYFTTPALGIYHHNMTGVEPVIIVVETLRIFPHTLL